MHRYTSHSSGQDSPAAPPPAAPAIPIAATPEETKVRRQNLLAARRQFFMRLHRLDAKIVKGFEPTKRISWDKLDEAKRQEIFRSERFCGLGHIQTLALLFHDIDFKPEHLHVCFTEDMHRNSYPLFIRHTCTYPMVQDARELAPHLAVHVNIADITRSNFYSLPLHSNDTVNPDQFRPRQWLDTWINSTVTYAPDLNLLPITPLFVTNPLYQEECFQTLLYVLLRPMTSYRKLAVECSNNDPLIVNHLCSNVAKIQANAMHLLVTIPEFRNRFMSVTNGYFSHIIGSLCDESRQLGLSTDLVAQNIGDQIRDMRLGLRDAAAATVAPPLHTSDDSSATSTTTIAAETTSTSSMTEDASVSSVSAATSTSFSSVPTQSSSLSPHSSVASATPEAVTTMPRESKTFRPSQAQQQEDQRRALIMLLIPIVARFRSLSGSSPAPASPVSVTTTHSTPIRAFPASAATSSTQSHSRSVGNRDSSRNHSATHSTLTLPSIAEKSSTSSPGFR